MKIVTRPEPEVAGSGPFTMRMSMEELQYLSAVLYTTRLGSAHVYRQAAYNLMQNIEELTDDEFMDQAFEDVQIKVSVSDDEGNTIGCYSAENFTIEV